MLCYTQHSIPGCNQIPDDMHTSLVYFYIDSSLSMSELFVPLAERALFKILPFLVVFL